MAPGIQITFDAHDPHALAAWWSALLGYEVEQAPEFVAGLLESGAITDADVLRVDGVLTFADAVAAKDPSGGRPRLYFQRVPEEKVAKNRVHLDVDLDANDLDTEVARVVASGASFVEYGTQGSHRWAVMHDPEGNEFCLH